MYNILYARLKIGFSNVSKRRRTIKHIYSGTVISFVLRYYSCTRRVLSKWSHRVFSSQHSYSNMLFKLSEHRIRLVGQKSIMILSLLSTVRVTARWHRSYHRSSIKKRRLKAVFLVTKLLFYILLPLLKTGKTERNIYSIHRRLYSNSRIKTNKQAWLYGKSNFTLSVHLNSNQTLLKDHAMNIVLRTVHCKFY